MICNFPTPKEIPYEVRQKVMNNVFPKKWSLMKRASLVSIFSVSLSFLGIMVLFSFLYIKNNYNSLLGWSSLHIDEKATSSQIVSSEGQPIEDIVFKWEDLDNIELLISETENLLAELESLI